MRHAHSSLAPSAEAPGRGGGRRHAAYLTFYALFGGADFGGGFWDLIAGDAEKGERPRALIQRSLTPVWEANHVWLIFILVVLWTAFPPAFSAVMTTLYVPIALKPVGIWSQARARHGRSLGKVSVSPSSWCFDTIKFFFACQTNKEQSFLQQSETQVPSRSGNSQVEATWKSKCFSQKVNKTKFLLKERLHVLREPHKEASL